MGVLSNRKHVNNRGGSTRAKILYSPRLLHGPRPIGVYFDLSTASEVFRIFTTKLYSCLCNYNAIVFIS